MFEKWRCLFHGGPIRFPSAIWASWQQLKAELENKTEIFIQPRKAISGVLLRLQQFKNIVQSIVALKTFSSNFRA